MAISNRASATRRRLNVTGFVGHGMSGSAIWRTFRSGSPCGKRQCVVGILTECAVNDDAQCRLGDSFRRAVRITPRGEARPAQRTDPRPGGSGAKDLLDDRVRDRPRRVPLAVPTHDLEVLGPLEHAQPPLLDELPVDRPQPPANVVQVGTPSRAASRFIVPPALTTRSAAQTSDGPSTAATGTTSPLGSNARHACSGVRGSSTTCASVPRRCARTSSNSVFSRPAVVEAHRRGRAQDRDRAGPGSRPSSASTRGSGSKSASATCSLMPG